jgi:hypothetical protein
MMVPKNRLSVLGFKLSSFLYFLLFSFALGSAIVSQQFYATFLFYCHDIDSAGYVDLIKNISATGEMKSSVFSSAYPLFEVMSMDLKTLQLSGLESTYNYESFFKWHAYGVAYPLAWIVNIGVDSIHIATFSNVFGVLGMLLIVAVYGYGKNLNVWLIGAFCIALYFFSPINGSIYGQLYFDRIYPALMLIGCIWADRLLKQTSTSNFEKFGFVLLAIAIFSVSERAALMGGTFFVGYTLFGILKRQRKLSVNFVLTSVIGLFGITWYLIYTNIFLDSMYEVSVSRAVIALNLQSLFQPGPFQDNALIFAILILPMIFLGLLKPRAGIIMCGAVLPNFVLNVGGAEKVNFVTHYHLMYLPFIVFAGLKAAERVNEIANSVIAPKRKTAMHAFGATLLMGIAIFNATAGLNQAERSVTFSWENARAKVLYTHDWNRRDDPQSAPAWEGNIRRNIAEELAALLTNNEREVHVSISHALAPLLTQSPVGRVDAFPIGVYDADVIIVREHAMISGGHFQVDLPSFTQAEINEKTAFLMSFLENDLVLHKSWDIIPNVNRVSLYTSKEYNVNYVITDDNSEQPNLVALAKLSTLEQKATFSSELLVPLYTNKGDTWYFTGGKSTGPNNNIIVNLHTPAHTIIPITEGETYRLTATLQSVSEEALARLQVNWSTSNGSFISTNIEVVECKEIPSTYSMDVVAPNKASHATIYAVGHTDKNVSYLDLSFKR